MYEQNRIYQRSKKNNPSISADYAIYFTTTYKIMKNILTPYFIHKIIMKIYTALDFHTYCP